MEKVSDRLFKYYKDCLHKTDYPCIFVLNTIDGVSQNPNKNQEILAIFQERIPTFTNDTQLMQGVISQYEERILKKINRGITPKEQLYYCKKLVSCKIVSELLRKTIEMLNA